jgi:hypothetical protein
MDFKTDLAATLEVRAVLYAQSYFVPLFRQDPIIQSLAINVWFF